MVAGLVAWAITAILVAGFVSVVFLLHAAYRADMEDDE